MDRSVRWLLAAVLLTAAVLLAVNLLVTEETPVSWGLVLLLAVIGVVLGVWAWRDERAESDQSAAATKLTEAEALKAKAAAKVSADAEAAAKARAKAEAEAKAKQESAAKAKAEAEAKAKQEAEAKAKAEAEAKAKEEAEAKAKAEAAAKKTQEAELKPKAKPAAGKPDNLTVVEGIGPKMSAALVAAGIDTYAKLAAASEDTLRAAVESAGMRLAPSIPTWAEQAGYAAKGDWDGLKALQGTLKGGRRE